MKKTENYIKISKERVAHLAIIAFSCSKIRYGCTGGSSDSEALLIAAVGHTRCKTKRMASLNLLFLEADCFNLEVNKHHACSQHPNPELLETGTLTLPPTGNQRLDCQNSSLLVLF